MVRILKYFTQWRYRINPIKTLYFNFRKFRFKEAVRFPVLIGNNVIFRCLDGKVVLNKLTNGGGVK